VRKEFQRNGQGSRKKMIQ